jgi:hypothetical protein
LATRNDSSGATETATAAAPAAVVTSAATATTAASDQGGAAPTAIPTAKPNLAPATVAQSSPTPAPAAPQSNDSADTWFHTKDGTFVDGTGKRLLLRGFVTITNNTDGSPVRYTSADYQKMKSMGVNVQSIRLGAGALGAWPGKKINPSYLEQIDSMVSLAKATGIYSEFKVTLYDVGGFQPSQVAGTWDNFWNTGSGTQDAVIAGWMTIWQRYLNEPFVVGYDLVNEPQQGSLKLDDTTFETQYLNPFYGKAIDKLRTIDKQHLAFFQPPYQSHAYQVPLNRDQVVYAPHFYPNFREYLAGKYVTTDYEPTMQRYLSEAALNKAPLFIGEYSMPWELSNDGNATIEKSYVVLERAAVNLFLKNNLSFTRPWYADDGSAIRIAGKVYGWGIIQGKKGVGGPVRSFITDVFATAAKS